MLSEQEQCTGQNCIRKIQEYLQVDRLWVLILMKDEDLIQIVLTLIREEDKLARDVYCEHCKTSVLIDKVEGLATSIISEDLASIKEDNSEEDEERLAELERLRVLEVKRKRIVQIEKDKRDRVKRNARLAKAKAVREEKERQERIKKQSRVTPERMVLIPAGEFEMGSNAGGDNEKPVHSVYLDSYFLDKYEVTLGQYKSCYDSGSCKKPRTGNYYNWGKGGRAQHPINGVDWEDATNYCRSVNKRLPTEAEWERAAGWKDGRKYRYPSGKSRVSCSDAVMNDGGKGCGKNRTWPVGSKTQEINGTYDMAGNVLEWVSDWKGSYSSGSQNNPAEASSGSYRVNRSGSWFSDASYLRSARRYYDYIPSYRNHIIGFRCAVSP